MPCIQVGCGGAYHSWSPIFPDNSTTDHQGLLINTSNLELENSDGKKIKFGRHGKFIYRLRAYRYIRPILFCITLLELSVQLKGKCGRGKAIELC